MTPTPSSIVRAGIFASVLAASAVIAISAAGAAPPPPARAEYLKDPILLRDVKRRARLASHTMECRRGGDNQFEIFIDDAGARMFSGVQRWTSAVHNAFQQRPGAGARNMGDTDISFYIKSVSSALARVCPGNNVTRIIFGAVPANIGNLADRRIDPEFSGVTFDNKPVPYAHQKFFIDKDGQLSRMFEAPDDGSFILLFSQPEAIPRQNGQLHDFFPAGEANSMFFARHGALRFEPPPPSVTITCRQIAAALDGPPELKALAAVIDQGAAAWRPTDFHDINAALQSPFGERVHEVLRPATLGGLTRGHPQWPDISSFVVATFYASCKQQEKDAAFIEKLSKIIKKKEQEISATGSIVIDRNSDELLKIAGDIKSYLIIIEKYQRTLQHRDNNHLWLRWRKFKLAPEPLPHDDVIRATSIDSVMKVLGKLYQQQYQIISGEIEKSSNLNELTGIYTKYIGEHMPSDYHKSKYELYILLQEEKNKKLQQGGLFAQLLAVNGGRYANQDVYGGTSIFALIADLEPAEQLWRQAEDKSRQLQRPHPAAAPSGPPKGGDGISAFVNTMVGSNMLYNTRVGPWAFELGAAGLTNVIDIYDVKIDSCKLQPDQRYLCRYRVAAGAMSRNEYTRPASADRTLSIPQLLAQSEWRAKNRSAIAKMIASAKVNEDIFQYTANGWIMPEVLSSARVEGFAALIDAYAEAGAAALAGACATAGVFAPKVCRD